jgi:hypothetical protein
MKRDLMIQKRKKARELREKGWGINRIARYLMAGKENVRRWLELGEDDLEVDSRGWKKGRSRKHGADVKERVLLVRKELEQTPGARIGADTIRDIMRESYDLDVSRWFVNQALKEAEMVRQLQIPPRKTPLFKRAVSLKSLKHFGDVILLVNFLKLSQSRHEEPVSHLLFCRYLRPHKTGIVKMVTQRNSNSLMEYLKMLWRGHPIPDILMMSGSDWSLGGHSPHRRSLGKLAFFLLNLGIKPMYLGREILNRQNALKGFSEVLTGDFIKLTMDSESDGGQWQVDDFFLQYRKGAGFSSRRIEMKNRVFKTALKYLDLENRKIGLFLAFEILFLQVARRKEGITVLGVEVPVGEQYWEQLLLARLDLRFHKLYVYVEGDDGNWRQVFAREFSVQNVIYQ